NDKLIIRSKYMKIAQNLGKEFLGKSMGPFKEKDLTDAISNTIERNPKKAVQKLIRLFGDELEEGFDMLGREKDNQNEKALKKYQKKNKSASEEQEEKKRYALQKELEKKAAQKIKLGLEHVSKLMENILGTEE